MKKGTYLFFTSLLLLLVGCSSNNQETKKESSKASNVDNSTIEKITPKSLASNSETTIWYRISRDTSIGKNTTVKPYVFQNYTMTAYNSIKLGDIATANDSGLDILETLEKNELSSQEEDGDYYEEPKEYNIKDFLITTDDTGNKPVIESMEVIQEKNQGNTEFFLSFSAYGTSTISQIYQTHFHGFSIVNQLVQGSLNEVGDSGQLITIVDPNKTPIFLLDSLDTEGINIE